MADANCDVHFQINLMKADTWPAERSLKNHNVLDQLYTVDLFQFHFLMPNSLRSQAREALGLGMLG